jgi:hypothetical protein
MGREAAGLCCFQVIPRFSDNQSVVLSLTSRCPLEVAVALRGRLRQGALLVSQTHPCSLLSLQSNAKKRLSALGVIDSVRQDWQMSVFNLN